MLPSSEPVHVSLALAEALTALGRPPPVAAYLAREGHVWVARCAWRDTRVELRDVLATSAMARLRQLLADAGHAGEVAWADTTAVAR